ncbi:hypothetical protein SALBM217S_04681 [Streptomyces griseoloalbus]
MLRLEVRNSQTPIERKPEWIKTRATAEYSKMQNLVKSEGLHTRVPGPARRSPRPTTGCARWAT